MLYTKTNKPYETPVCDIVELMQQGVLCSSPQNPGGSTEDLGDFEEIFGI